MLKTIWDRYITGTRVQAARECELYRSETPQRERDRHVVIVFATILMSMLFIRFFGNPQNTELTRSVLSGIGLDGWATELKHWLHADADARLNQRTYWAIWRVFGYAILPMIVIVVWLREPLAEYGMKVRGTFGHWKIYAVLLVGIAPVVFIASYSGDFQAKYPFYRVARGEDLWPAFWTWELLYAGQFVGLEIFFRGFMVHGLKRHMGFLAVPVMMVPYLMIHFSKPFAEASGSIIAGFVLGALALKSRSVWWGAVVHVVVAVSMDVLSLWQRGLL